jgi:hypothetical protein
MVGQKCVLRAKFCYQVRTPTPRRRDICVVTRLSMSVTISGKTPSFDAIIQKVAAFEKTLSNESRAFTDYPIDNSNAARRARAATKVTADSARGVGGVIEDLPFRLPPGAVSTP